MKKSALAILLALLLTVSLLTVGALADDVYELWVNGAQVTSANASDVLGDGSVSYDAASNTLTLNGANVKGINFTDADADAVIEFSGENTVTGWIYGWGSLTLRGNGLLTVTATEIEPSNSASICADGGLRFESGSYDVTSPASNAIYSPEAIEFVGTASVKAASEGTYPTIVSKESVAISEGALVDTSGDAIAIDSASITMTGGTLKAVSTGDAAIYSGSDFAVSGGKVEAHSDVNSALYIIGKVLVSGNADIKATADLFQAVLAYGGLDMSGGTLYANSYDETAIWAKGSSISITGGSVTAISTNSSAISAQETLTISGADTVVNASSDVDGFSALRSTETLSITDGAKVNVVNTKGGGIDSSAGVIITGSGTKVEASNGATNSAAIISPGNIAISDGAEVSVAGDGNGIYSTTGDVSISDSVVKSDISKPNKYYSVYSENTAVSDSWVDLPSDDGITPTDSVMFTGSEGKVYGDFTVTDSVEIADGKTLVVPEGEKLTVADSGKLTVADGGKLVVEQGAQADNKGTVVVGGEFENNGSYFDEGVTEGDIGGSGEFPNYWFVTVKYGSGAADKVYNVVKGKAFTLPDAPGNSGYIFLGWRCGDATYKAGETVTVNSDMTFTAVWGNLPDVDPEEPEEPEVPDFPFYDVNIRDWYYDAVYYVWDKGLMDGVDTHEFAPNATLTRAMVWTIIARAEGVDTTGGNSWYAKAQEWVVAKGISDGENPSAAITRQELVTMLYRLAGEPAVSGTITAPDAASVSAWASDAMVWAMNIGLIEGDENGAVTPTATATRAQAAAIFMRYIEA